MSDEKYIVKNCPAYDKDEKLGYTCTTLSVDVAECENCTDCLIKQVVDDCKESIEYYENEGWKLDNMLEHSGKANMAFRLLQLFEIEEC